MRVKTPMGLERLEVGKKIEKWAQIPPRGDPLSSWSRRRRLNKKVASIWLKIANRVAYG